jgi:hypothetical protein
VKDHTEPTANIEVGSAILYGYLRSAKGDTNAALKSYGGSQAYAQKVSLRAGDFASVTTPQDTAKPADAESGTCDARTDGRCLVPGNWANAFTIPSRASVGDRANGGVTSAGLPATSK